MKIRIKDEVYNQVYFMFALTNYMQENKEKSMGSGVKMAVTATVLGKEEFVVPPIELQNEFAEFVKEVDKSKVVVQKALDEAQTLFDSLMQQYFC